MMQNSSQFAATPPSSEFSRCLIRTLAIFLLTFCSLVVLAETAPTDVIYVSAEQGNDTNDGRSWDNAVATLHQAISKAQAAGLTNVYVAGGEYPLTAQLSVPAGINVIGSWNPATNKRVQPTPEQPWLFANPTEIIGWDASKHSTAVVSTAGCTLDGLVIRNGHGGGISNRGNNTTIVNCIVRDNEILAGGGFAGGIGLANPNGVSYSGIVIDKCWVHNNTFYSNGGSYANHSAAGISGHRDGGSGATITNCWVTNNKALNNGKSGNDMAGPGGMWLRSASVVENCLIANNESENSANRCGGIMGHSGDKSIRILNCTVVNNKSASVNIASGIADAGFVFNTIAYNNVIARGETAQWNALGTAPNGGYNYVADPSFVNPSIVLGYDAFSATSYGWDYTVNGTSATVDAGDNVQVTETEDLMGNPRIVNDIVDIGAYEFQRSMSVTPSVTAINLPQVGGETTLTLTCLEACTWTLTPSDNSFCTIVPLSGTLAAGEEVQISIQCTANSAFMARNVTLTLSDGLSTKRLPLSQDGLVFFGPVYVSPTGDDAHDGASWEKPVQTLERAIERCAVATVDKTIYAAEGTYTPRAQLTLPAGAQLRGGYVLGTQTVNGRSIIDASATLAAQAKTFELSAGTSGAFTTVANFDCRNGFNAFMLNSYTKIDNCRVFNYNSSAVPSDAGSCVNLASGCANAYVVNSVFEANTDQNEQRGYINDHGIGGPNYFVNCLFANNTSLLRSGYSGYGGAFVMGAHVYRNCTFVKNTSGINNYGSRAVEVSNCLFWGNERFDFRGGTSSITINNSLVNTTPLGSAVVLSSTNDDSSGPLFVSPATIAGTAGYSELNNWSIANLSLAVDAGSNDYVMSEYTSADLAGNPRIINDVVDIGAYEYMSGLSVTNLPVVTFGNEAVPAGTPLSDAWIAGTYTAQNYSGAAVEGHFVWGADQKVKLFAYEANAQFVPLDSSLYMPVDVLIPIPCSTDAPTVTPAEQTLAASARSASLKLNVGGAQNVSLHLDNVVWEKGDLKWITNINNLTLSETAPSFTLTTQANKAAGARSALCTLSGTVTSSDGERAPIECVVRITQARGSASPIRLTLTGMRVADKTYDGTTAAHVSFWGDLIDAEESIPDGVELVTNEAVVTFNTPEVGEALIVNVTGLKLGGRCADNYTYDGTGWCYGNIYALDTQVMLYNDMKHVENEEDAYARADVVAVRWEAPESLDNFIVEYSADLSFSEQLLVNNASSCLISGLKSQTTYNVRIRYDNTLGHSVFSNTVTVTTGYYTRLNAHAYPMVSLAADTRYTLRQISNSLTKSETDYLADQARDAARDVCMGQSVVLRHFTHAPAQLTAVVGLQNTLTFRVADTLGTEQAVMIAAWIDWNDNGQFESGERYTATRGSSYSKPDNVLSLNVDVPASAIAGSQVMMRVRTASSNGAIPSAVGLADNEAGVTWDLPLSLIPVGDMDAFTLTLEAGEHGHFVDGAGNPITEMAAVYGSTVTLTIKPDKGYSIENLLLNGAQEKIAYTLKLTNIVRNHTVKATFTDFPTMFINVADGSSITSKEVYKICSVRLEQNSCTPVGDAIVKTNTKDCEIKGRGNSTWGYSKKPYRLKFAKKDKQDFFNMGEERNWVLLANYIDPSGLKNDIAFKVGREIKVPFTYEAQHVRLILNGKYDGLYQLTEQCEVSENRVDVNELDEEVDEGVVDWLAEFDTYQDEYIFRTSHKPENTTWGSSGMPMKFKQPEIATNADPRASNDPNGNTVATYKCWKAATDQIVAFERALEGNLNNLGRPDLGYENHINPETFMDWLIVHMIASNNEPCHPKSSYFHSNSKKSSSEQRYNNGKISAGVLWDFDWAYGYQSSPSASRHRSLMKCMWYDDLFKYPKFKANFVKRYKAVHAQLFEQPDWTLFDYLNEKGDFIAKQQEQDYVRWSKNTTYAAERNKLVTWMNSNLKAIDTVIGELENELAAYTYPITCENSSFGTLTAPESGVWSDSIRVNVKAAERYNVAHVYCSDVEIVPKNGVFEFYMPQQDVTLRADYTFVESRPLLTVVNGTPASQYIATGETIVLTAEQRAGATFTNWTIDAEIISTDPVFTFTMLNTDVTITANFEQLPPPAPATYTLTVVNGTPDSATLFAGDTIVITAEERAGATFTNWTIDAVIISTEAVFTFTMIDTDVTITANFEQLPPVTKYEVNIVSGSGTGAYVAGTSVTIKANEPAEGMVFDQWTGDDAILSDVYAAEQVFIMPERALTLTATYKAIPPPWLGSGTEADPYRIYTRYELEILATKVNTGTRYQGVYFKLMNDLDLGVIPEGRTDSQWTPIGVSSMPFSGLFDGQSHTISNLYINNATQPYVGLFGYNDGTLSNIILTQAFVKGENHVGILVGENGNIIRQCRVSGCVTGETYVGGICGISWYADIMTCASSARVAGDQYVGGLAGSVTHIQNSFAAGDVEGNSSVGGLCGMLFIDGAENCYSTGNVRGKTKVGGLCGALFAAKKIANCYCTGRVVGTSEVGPFAGSNTKTTIENCHFNNETCGCSDNGLGVEKTTQSLKTAQMAKDLNGTQSPAPWVFVNGHYPCLTAFDLPTPLWNLSVVDGTPDSALLSAKESVTISYTGTVPQHFAFNGWMKNMTTLVSAQPTFTFTMPSENVTLTPQYTQIEFVHTLSVCDGTPATSQLYVGDTIVLTPVDPPAHCRFAKWSDGTTDSIYTFTMQDENCTVIAQYEAYEFVHELSVSGGTAHDTQLYVGDTTLVTADAAPDHYRFVQWSNGETEPVFVFTMPDTDVTLTAEYEQYEFLHTLTVHDGIAQDTQLYVGDTTRLIAQPTPKKQFVSWTLNDTPISSDSIFEFTMPDTDVLVVANYAVYYELTVNNGTPATQLLLAGTITTVTADAAPEHYRFSGWRDAYGDIVSVNNPYVFMMPDAAVTLTAEYEQYEFIHTLTVNNGTAQDTQLYVGETTTVTADAAPIHFRFVQWSNGETEPEFVFTMPDTDFVLTAEYEQYEFIHTLTVNNGTAQDTQLYVGETTTVTADAAPIHFRFVQWSNGDTEPEFVFTMPDTDYTLTAEYEQYEFIHTLTVNNGTAQDTQLYVGETTTVTADAAPIHFRFVQWSNGETEPEFVFTMPDTDYTLTAEYEQYEFVHTLTVNNGTAQDTQLYVGDTTTVTAENRQNWVFYAWYANGVMVAQVNPFVFTMYNENVTLEATFVRAVDGSSMALTTKETTQYIELTWNNIGANSYEIWRAEAGASPRFSKVATVKNSGRNPLVYQDGDVKLEYGKDYVYFIASKTTRTQAVYAMLEARPEREKFVASGVVFAVPADSVASVDSIAFDTPSFTGYYPNRVKPASKDKKESLTLDKMTSNSDSAYMFSKNDVPLFNTKAYNKRTNFSYEYMRVKDFDNGQLDSECVRITVKKADSAHKPELRTFVEAFFHRPNIDAVTTLDTSITFVNTPDSRCLYVALTQDDVTATLSGRYFGMKTPKVYVEYRNTKNGKIMKTALAVRTTRAPDPLTRSKVSDTQGTCQINVVIPMSKWYKAFGKETLETYKSFVLTNGKAFDAIEMDVIRPTLR